ncbi:VWA domain-containing protein [Leptolinea tardivitalis]|uniref:VWA domain-containing protein n=1 Tax=Leptolinea tardivitalis TaxID=229920 RepID=UPI000780C195|nr:VWA domain-containing protein [Leptolinea tardivitalis]GAP20076.1 DnaJ-class molecular chaperone with C-terminal Zn finger domain [Leptolinea tardivitalis]
MGAGLFETLGLSNNASPDEIRHAYFDAARRLHPDANPSPDAANQFMAIQKAYDVLSNTEKRIDYLISQAINEGRPPVIAQAQFSIESLQAIPEEQYIYALLEIINTEEAKAHVLPTSSVCLVIDRSTSMQDKRIDMVKKAAYELMKQLRQDDWVSIVTFSDRAEQVIPPTRVKKSMLSDPRIASIQTGGGTEILRGLECGLDVLTQTSNKDTNRHLILMTDGHTYGDEEECLQLAQQAGDKGIIISALGFGSEWNDTFLDRLTGLSGGTARLVTSVDELRQFIRSQVASLSKVYACNLNLHIEGSPQATLVDMFRIYPDASPLPVDIQARLGNLPFNDRIKILLEYKIAPKLNEGETITLLQGILTMEIPTRKEPLNRIEISLRRTVREDQEKSIPPRELVEAIEKLTLYRLQEKAREEEAAGDHVNATRHLKNLATRLLQKKESDNLGKMVLSEAEKIQSGKGYSPEAEKRIKYGTRALLLPMAKESKND